MKKQVKDIVHFHNGKGGGVWTVTNNLLRFSNNPQIRNHLVFTINQKEQPNFVPFEANGAVSVQVFGYSPDWNFYHTCRKLKKTLPSKEAVIVAHDWIELGMASNLGLPNPVVQFLHGDYPYYYELANKNEEVINRFVAVSKSIQERLTLQLPERKQEITYLRCPVPDATGIAATGRGLNIVFVGRLSRAKGYHLLPSIARKVYKSLPELTWHIVGEDTVSLHSTVKWESCIPVRFYGSVSNQQVSQLLQIMRVFILPSAAEGMPVSLIEAMKAGVVPLVNDIDGGIQELIEDSFTGYKIPGNDVDLYAARIIALANDPGLCAKLSRQCTLVANKLFDPVVNTALIEGVFLKAVQSNKPKIPLKVYGSRLDHPWVPNRITTLIRKVK